MKRYHFAACVLLGGAIAAGCSTTQVTSNPVPLQGRLARPNRILVYNFAASAADLGPQEQGAYSDPMGAPPPDQLELGRKLGTEVARRIVDSVNGMGLSAVVGNYAAPAQPGDIVIEGHFESVDEGSAAKRWVVGFGSGKAELRTVVTGYVRTRDGFQRVGTGTVNSAGGKGPGLFVPIIVTAATANPIGLIISGAAKAEGQISGRTTIEGAAKRTAEAVSERMKERFQQEGWI
ncbi:MAG TPA: DUF4410 domain-containing protein [Candidatus Binatia bacterium]|jgi:hypothetical protein